jgi:hypothetical protein
VAEPRVRVQVNREQMEMIAGTAGPVERDVWWPRIVAAYDGYAVYQSRTDRVIPILFLDPVR